MGTLIQGLYIQNYEKEGIYVWSRWHYSFIVFLKSTNETIEKILYKTFAEKTIRGFLCHYGLV